MRINLPIRGGKTRRGRRIVNSITQRRLLPLFLNFHLSSIWSNLQFAYYNGKCKPLRVLLGKIVRMHTQYAMRTQLGTLNVGTLDTPKSLPLNTHYTLSYNVRSVEQKWNKWQKWWCVCRNSWCLDRGKLVPSNHHCPQHGTIYIQFLLWYETNKQQTRH